MTKYIFQDHVPPPPDDTAAESPKLQFSVVECILFAFHQLLNKVINLLPISHYTIIIIIIIITISVLSFYQRMRRDSSYYVIVYNILLVAHRHTITSYRQH